MTAFTCFASKDLSFSPGFSPVQEQLLPGNRENGCAMTSLRYTRLKPGENERGALGQSYFH
jgi:hypothetical protein